MALINTVHAKKEPTRYFSNKQEKQVAKKFNGNQTKNSGATPFQKGDVCIENVLLECKTKMSPSESMSIKKEWLEKLKEEQLDLKNQVSALKQKLLAYQAKEIDVTPELVKVFDSELSGNEPRELMNILLERGAKICAIFAGNDEEGYRYVIGSHSEDVRVISKKLNEAFQGRGGGKPQMVQGSLKGTAKNISEIL